MGSKCTNVHLNFLLAIHCPLIFMRYKYFLIPKLCLNYLLRRLVRLVRCLPTRPVLPPFHQCFHSCAMLWQRCLHRVLFGQTRQTQLLSCFQQLRKAIWKSFHLLALRLQIIWCVAKWRYAFWKQKQPIPMPIDVIVLKSYLVTHSFPCRIKSRAIFGKKPNRVTFKRSAIS